MAERKTTKRVAPLPCPFCGQEPTRRKSKAGENWVACTGCGAIGPFKKTTQGAINAWNKRAPAK